MSYNLGTAEGRIIIDGSGAQKGFAVASAAAEAFFGVIQSKLDSVERLGENLIKIGASGTVGIGAAVKVAASFEQGLSNIRAVSGATAQEMDGIRKTALRLGKDTVFSATEAASAMEALIKAGVSTQDVMTGAADATVNLAAAGGVDLTEAAEIAANALNNFNLEGKDMAQVSDLIAGAANASAIDVHDFGFSLSQAGAVANLAGLEFKDLAVAIAEMGQAGIKGSDAGTSIKTFLTNLIPTMDKQKELFRELGLLTVNQQKAMQFLASKGIKPTDTSMRGLSDAMEKYVDESGGAAVGTATNAKQAQELAQKMGIMQNAFFDANGEVKSMAEIQEVLKNATKGMTREQKLATLETLFGSDAIRAAAVFADQGAKGYNDMAAAMGKVGAADVAATRLDNLNGSIEQLKGSFETMMIIIGEVFLPLVRKMVDAITSAINIFNNLPEPVQKGIAVMLGMGTAMSLLTGILIKMLFVLTPMLAKFLGLTALKQIFSIFTVGFKALRGGQGVMLALAASTGRLGVVFGRFQKAGMILFTFLKRFPKVLMALRAAWVFAFGPWGVAIALVVAAVVLLYKKFQPFHDLVNRIATAVKDFTEGVWAKFMQGIHAFVEVLKGNGLTTKGGFVGLMEQLGLVALDLWNALKSLVDLFKAEVVPALQEAGRVIQAEFGKSLQDVANTFETTIIPAAHDLADTFVTDVMPALRQLATALRPVVEGILKFQLAVAGGLLIALFKIAQFIIKYVLPATIKLNTYFIVYLVKAIALVIQYIVFINAAWIEFVRILVVVVKAALDLFINIWKTTWNLLKAAVEIATNAVIAVIKGFINLFTTLWNGFWSSGVGQIVIAVFQLIKVTIQVALTAIVVVVTQALQVIWNIWSTIWQGVGQILTKLWAVLMPLTQTAVSTIKNAVVGAWNFVKNFTLTSWRLFQQYVVGPLNTVVSKVVGFASSIISKIRSAFSSVNNQANSSWRGFYNTIKGWIQNVINLVNGIKGRVLGALAGAGSWLWNAGANIIRGLLNGINSMIGQVRGALNNLTGLIPSWKGPESTDKKLLTRNGMLIMKSLLDGLQSEFPAVRRVLQDITTAIPGTMDVNVVGKRISQGAGSGGAPAWAQRALAERGIQVQNNWVVNNPVAEKTSTTTTREATRRASLGMVA